ncbi:MAG: hypothetical protein KKE30_18435 [Gammaproteobacteria bacterium]|uniref:Uncharacterized protein n=1 Tax=viral metagenome TaxID=1070528 RepID=A0A6M3LMD9_9ZZZZ|nr:hypothetical protein [Gammaproteobacteria bacterium]MBU2426154.1 hypothetical protein [Gammaproteobacteria bacterium]
MKELNLKEVSSVAGGKGKGGSGGSVATNAAIAIVTCGKDKVKSVSTDGFECK